MIGKFGPTPAPRPEDDLLEALRPDAEGLARLADLLFEPELLDLPLLPPLRLCAMTRSLRCLRSGGLSHERCKDGRVVGQPDPQPAGVVQLALLGRQPPRALDH